MKKSTMAIAALLTVLTAPVVSVAYADEVTAPVSSGCHGCKACAGSMECKGCAGCSGD